MSRNGIVRWEYQREVKLVDRIEILEYLTAAYAADVEGDDILIGVDSVVAGHWLRKEGTAPTILPPPHLGRKTVRVIYVPTDLNPADVPTREASAKLGFEGWDAAGKSRTIEWEGPMEEEFLIFWCKMFRFTLVLHQEPIRVLWNPLARGIASLFVEERRMRLTQSKKCEETKHSTSDEELVENDNIEETKEVM